MWGTIGFIQMGKKCGKNCPKFKFGEFKQLSSAGQAHTSLVGSTRSSNFKNLAEHHPTFITPAIGFIKVGPPHK